MSHPNFEHIFGSVYVVRTQAGFKQATRHYLKGATDVDHCCGYPTSYPSVVSFDHRYDGGGYALTARCEHLTLVKAKLEKH
jgi:hypothetical protein